LGALSERQPTGSQENTKPSLNTFYLQQKPSQEAKRFRPIKTLTKQTLDEVKKRLCQGTKLTQKFWMK
jgi:hypothetical protein